MKSAIFLTLLAFVFNASCADQQQSGETAESYVEPKIIEYKMPVYPLNQARKSNSGMVELQMMVSKERKVFEPVIIASTNRAFERPAIKAAEGYQYEPALENGRPVEARQEIRIRFEMENNSDVVDKDFARRYRRAVAELASESPDKEKVDNLINKMRHGTLMTPYAFGRLNALRAQRAVAFSDVDQRIEAMRRLLIFDRHVKRKNRVLDDETRLNFQKSLFRLFIITNRLSEAKRTYEAMSDGGSLKENELADLVNKIDALIVGQADPLVTKFKLLDHGYALEDIFKPAFSFIDVHGEIQKLKLRCDSRFKELDFQVDAEYRIPKSWGFCVIEIIGKPDSTAKLVHLS